MNRKRWSCEEKLSIALGEGMVKIRSLRPQKSWPGCLHKGKRMMVEMIRRDGLKLKEALTV